jgi:hypothetical protein
MADVSRKADKLERPGTRMVNVGIAPWNEVRLRNYIEWHNKHPSRSRPVVTATDIVNEALDVFLSDSPQDAGDSMISSKSGS